MNKRIKELALQAGFQYEQVKDIWYLEGLNPSCDQEFGKFAELIVRECMRICDVAQVGYLTHGHTLQGEGCQGAKRYISDWFEVEE